jgi:sugar O-acyltransferase (sialic acid O-acetyltransferase NeuD family)
LTNDIVVYGVGSPLLVDYEESLAKAGFKIYIAIDNVPCKSWLTKGPPVVKPHAIDPAIFALPFLVPLFTPGHRQTAALEARKIGFRNSFNLVDISVSMPRVSTVEDGLFINSGCSIGAGSQFGEFVCINRGTSIGHHVHLERFVSIGPGAVIGAMVRISKGAVVGTGAVILPKINIGENSVVGAGAVVTRDVPPHSLVFGNPARIVREGILGYNDLTVE